MREDIYQVRPESGVFAAEAGAGIKHVVISTHKGLFRYTPLPYGISSAPGIFKKATEQLLQGIPQLFVNLIATETETEHLRVLGEVLKCLAKAELRLKKHKCKFLVPSVPYLGYVVDADGVRPLPEKITATHQAPTPNNVTELKTYLGLLTYYVSTMIGTRPSVQ